MLKYLEIENTVLAELIDEKFIISQPQDILDLIGDSVSYNCSSLMIREQNLHTDFFRLHTGLAGEILQKFSNYNFKFAVIGDFSKYKNKSLQDFIRESNKGRSIFVVNTREDAINKMVRK